MDTPTYDFIPAQVRPQTARLVERCMYCDGSGIEPTGEHMSACGACNGTGLTVRMDAAEEVLALHAALDGVAKAIETTPRLEHLRPGGCIEVRLTDKQIKQVQDAVAACALPEPGGR